MKNRFIVFILGLMLLQPFQAEAFFDSKYAPWLGYGTWFALTSFVTYCWMNQTPHVNQPNDISVTIPMRMRIAVQGDPTIQYGNYPMVHPLIKLKPNSKLPTTYIHETIESNLPYLLEKYRKEDNQNPDYFALHTQNASMLSQLSRYRHQGWKYVGPIDEQHLYGNIPIAGVRFVPETRNDLD